MEVITRNQLAAIAADKWGRQYRDFDKWSGDKIDIYNKLRSLGNNPTPEQVNEAIGNTSWTDLKCGECGSYVESLIRVGQKPDYDSETAYVCEKCLSEALNQLKGQTK